MMGYLDDTTRCVLITTNKYLKTFEQEWNDPNVFIYDFQQGGIDKTALKRFENRFVFIDFDFPLLRYAKLFVKELLRFHPVSIAINAYETKQENAFAIAHFDGNPRIAYDGLGFFKVKENGDVVTA